MYDGKNNNNLYLLRETHYISYVFKQIKPLYFCISSPYGFVFLFIKLKACAGERSATALSKTPTTKTQTKPP